MKYHSNLEEHRMKQTYGYARVSARDQNEARQLDALSAFPVREDHIYIDKQSGKDFERPQYKKLMKKLRAGDLFVVHSIDRLGRNYEEILKQWRIITKEKEADIVVLDFPLLDTRTRHGDSDLTGRFIADLVLQILAYVAQTERENIRRRQAEGIASARARGVKLGRRRAPLPDNFFEIAQAWRDKKITLQQAANACKMPKGTFYSKVKEQEKTV